MTNSYPSKQAVVRTYEVPNAPTGESTRYVTEDGSVWKPCSSVPNTIGTGDKYGRLR